MTVLGIETSCDETAASVIQDGEQILSNVVLSQIDIHKAYGGVVPEVAARSHLEAITPVIDQALRSAFQGASLEQAWDKIDAIAVTYGAGLSGSLLIGTLAARVLAITKNKPLYACNHVVGHVFANFLTKDAANELEMPSKAPEYPLLALIVSGKHSQLVIFRNHFDYDVLGTTRDDAIGEAFDKVAKILKLPYPGGPSIAAAAEAGDPHAYSFTKPKVDDTYGYSFSGLKTGVLRLAQAEAGGDYRLPSFEIADKLTEVQKANIAASFQRTAIEIVVDKTVQAFEQYSPRSVVIAGGVAASEELRVQLTERLPINPDFAPPALCTDNGAMIGCLGCFMAAEARGAADPYTLAIDPSLQM